MAKLTPPIAPNIPLSSREYNPNQQEQISNALRLYFSRIDNMSRVLTRPINADGVSADFDFIDFNSTAVVPEKLARAHWNQTDQTLNIGMDYDVVQQVGQELYARVINSTGVDILNGTVVGFVGAVPDALNVAPYLADGVSSSLYAIGVMTHTLPDSGSKGYCTTWGFVRGLDTSAFTAGDILYASPTIAGALTKIKPTAPDNVVVIAACVVSDATDGVIFVRPTITQQMYYGTFARTTDFTPTLINTAYAVPFNVTVITNGVVIGTPASRIVVPQSGFYNASVTIQYISSNASSKTVYSWLRVNGVNVPDSSRIITLTGNGVYTTVAIEETISLTANSYVEVMTATSDATVTLAAVPATAFSPRAPAVNLNLSQVQQ